MSKVGEQSPVVAQMIEASREVRALLGGGKAMRAFGETYLPKFPMEHEDEYKARLANSWLFEGVGKALDDYVDRVFDKPISPNDEGELGTWCENIDLEGRDLSNFAQDTFRNAVADGVAYIMVDAPKRPEGPVTRGQAQQMNLRPYLVNVAVSDVLGWKFDHSKGYPVLSQWRMMEAVSEADPKDEFATQSIEQIRVLDLIDGRVQVRLYRKEDKTKTWAIFDEYLTDFQQIMISPVYTNRTGLLTGKTKLARMAELNMYHWRAQSDQTNTLHYNKAPLKVFTGWNPEELKGAKDAPGYAFVSSNPDAKAYTLDHDGKSIESGRLELKDVEQQMQWMGLQLIMSRASGATATGDVVDERKSASALSRWADNLKDGIEIALGWMLEVGGIEGEQDITISKEYTTVHLNGSDMDTLVKIGVSPETLISEAKRRGILADDVDVAEELDRMNASLMDQPGV